MQYYYIFIIIVVACLQAYRILKTRRNTKSAGNLLSVYDHNSSIGGIYLVIFFQIAIIYNDIFREKTSIILWLLPLFFILLLAYLRSSRKIYVYENGILVFGDFIVWDRIESVKIDKKEIQIVAILKEKQYYTISQIKNVGKCYNEIIKMATHLTVYHTPVMETTEPEIDEFLNKS